MKGSGWKRIFLKYFKLVREGGIAFYLSGKEAGGRFFFVKIPAEILVA